MLSRFIRWEANVVVSFAVPVRMCGLSRTAWALVLIAERKRKTADFLAHRGW